MKKKSLLTSMFLVAAFMTVSAKPRTTAQMLGAAQQVLSGTSLTKSLSAQDLKVLQTESQLTVIGYDNGACAIIANDDQFDAVLGYTDKPLTGDPAPGFLWWLETMNASLEQQMSEGVTVKASEATHKYTKVDPLLTTTWNQGTPYNNLCPEYTSGKVTARYVTGCVATAMAQVMAYHKWPVTGNKSISYTYTDNVTGEIRRLTANPGKTTYDYANMLDDYASNNYNDDQATAVATLMYHCGLSVKMEYTVDGSGSMVYDACRAVRRYFRYQDYTPYYYRSVMSTTEWMNLIYRELDDACPVLYAGVSSGGHCFVFDGYNEKGQVHVNWGWGGSGDGFFTVSSLNGYSSQQQMVLMRTTDDTRIKYDYRSLFGAMSSMTMAYRNDHVNATGTIYNMDPDAFTGDLGLMACNLSTGEVTALGTESLSSIVLFDGLNADIDGPTEGLADGEYRVYFATKSSKETDWQPVRTSDSYRNSYLMTKKGDGVSLTAEKSNADWMTGIGDIKVNKSTSAATTVRVYDTTGREVYSAPASTFSLNDVPATGMLIIKQGAESKKVIK